MFPILADWLRRPWIPRVLLAMCIVALLFGVAVAAYAAHLRRSARALIASAKQIHSTADAEHEIAMWRERSGRGYSESRSRMAQAMHTSSKWAMVCFRDSI